jgi:hypothetical protein
MLPCEETEGVEEYEVDGLNLRRSDETDAAPAGAMQCSGMSETLRYKLGHSGS